MPDKITSSGTNSQGNNYDIRVDSQGNTGYHYSNTDNSYYYSNTDGSKYYNDGKGYSQYTSTDGNTSKSYSSKK